LDRNGFKKSESGFDMNKTNPFLFISIHFRLLGVILEYFAQTLQLVWLSSRREHYPP